ncbi:hypothetical protein CMALT394_10089 [Carnobacterium maltaromaticum]|nr:hypothetical protein CMALT394_10089 [Carnobacterium maltaromaticum]
MSTPIDKHISVYLNLFTNFIFKSIEFQQIKSNSLWTSFYQLYSPINLK